MAGENASPAQPGLSGDSIENRSDNSFQIVEFLLGQDHFAIELIDVKEVVKYCRITRVPNSPPYIKGIIDLRGEITTIIDLKEQLAISGISATGEERARIIILDDRITHSKIGIMVDDVLAVLTMHSDQVDETATSGDEGTRVMGIIKKKTENMGNEKIQLLIWLDIKGLIRDMENRG